MKVCSKCKEAKPVEAFTKCESKPDGRNAYCRECRHAYYRSNRSRYIAQSKAWQKANPRRKREMRWKNAGILAPTLEPFTVAHFDAMLAAQGGRCAICFRSEPNGKSWHVDHVKVSGKWGPARGILCPSCNLSLGHLGDDWDTILSAADYVRSAAPLIDAAAASIGVADGQ